jgi:hypothetical protein
MQKIKIYIQESANAGCILQELGVGLGDLGDGEARGAIGTGNKGNGFIKQGMGVPVNLTAKLGGRLYWE